MRISIFIIGLIAFMMILAGSLAPLIVEMNDYNPTGNTSKLDSYNKMSELSQQAQEIKNQSLSLKSEQGIADIVGRFFSGGYQALKTTTKSFDVFQSVSEQAIDDSGIDNAGIFKNGLMTIVIIAIFLGIIISAVVKWVI
jgi:hypothetical protein